MSETPPPSTSKAGGGENTIAGDAASNLQPQQLRGGSDTLVCPTCGKVFTGSISTGGLRSNYNRHLLTHSEVKPYACPGCDATFATSSNLKRHVQRRHPQLMATVVGGLQSRPSSASRARQSSQQQQQPSATIGSSAGGGVVISSMAKARPTTRENSSSQHQRTTASSSSQVRGNSSGGVDDDLTSSALVSPSSSTYVGWGGSGGWGAASTSSSTTATTANAAVLTQPPTAVVGVGPSPTNSTASVASVFAPVETNKPTSCIRETTPTLLDDSVRVVLASSPAPPPLQAAATNSTTEVTEGKRADSPAPIRDNGGGGKSASSASGGGAFGSFLTPSSLTGGFASNTFASFFLQQSSLLDVAAAAGSSLGKGANQAIPTLSSPAGQHQQQPSLHVCKFEGCGKQFVWKNSLTQHIYLHHRDVKEEFICDACQSVLSSMTKLRRHQREHCPFRDDSATNKIVDVKFQKVIPLRPSATLVSSSSVSPSAPSSRGHSEGGMATKSINTANDRPSKSSSRDRASVVVVGAAASSVATGSDVGCRDLEAAVDTLLAVVAKSADNAAANAAPTPTDATLPPLLPTIVGSRSSAERRKIRSASTTPCLGPIGIGGGKRLRGRGKRRREVGHAHESDDYEEEEDDEAEENDSAAGGADSSAEDGDDDHHSFVYSSDEEDLGAFALNSTERGMHHHGEDDGGDDGRAPLSLSKTEKNRKRHLKAKERRRRAKERRERAKETRKRYRSEQQTASLLVSKTKTPAKESISDFIAKVSTPTTTATASRLTPNSRTAGGDGVNAFPSVSSIAANSASAGEDVVVAVNDHTAAAKVDDAGDGATTRGNADEEVVIVEGKLLVASSSSFAQANASLGLGGKGGGGLPSSAIVSKRLKSPANFTVRQFPNVPTMNSRNNGNSATTTTPSSVVISRPIPLNTPTGAGDSHSNDGGGVADALVSPAAAKADHASMSIFARDVLPTTACKEEKKRRESESDDDDDDNVEDLNEEDVHRSAYALMHSEFVCPFSCFFNHRDQNRSSLSSVSSTTAAAAAGDSEDGKQQHRRCRAKPFSKRQALIAHMKRSHPEVLQQPPTSSSLLLLSSSDLLAAETATSTLSE